MRSVLVTGGAGFIGSHLADALVMPGGTRTNFAFWGMCAVGIAASRPSSTGRAQPANDPS